MEWDCGNCKHFKTCGFFDIYTEEGTCNLRPFPLPPASRTCPPAVRDNYNPVELPALHGDGTRGFVIVRAHYYCSRFEMRPGVRETLRAFKAAYRPTMLATRLVGR